MGKVKFIGAVIATATIASAYCGVFLEDADAAPLPEGTIGYVKGSWRQSCEREPLAERACSTSDEHVRCFQVTNTGTLPVFCNTAMTAGMKNRGTLHRASYTTTAPTFVTAGSVIWVCLAWDPILQNDGHDPRAWDLEDVAEPVASCGEQPGERPPCSEQMLQEQRCPSAKPLPRCDSPMGDCTQG